MLISLSKHTEVSHPLSLIFWAGPYLWTSPLLGFHLSFSMYTFFLIYIHPIAEENIVSQTSSWSFIYWIPSHYYFVRKLCTCSFFMLWNTLSFLVLPQVTPGKLLSLPCLHMEFIFMLYSSKLISPPLWRVSDLPDWLAFWSILFSNCICTCLFEALINLNHSYFSFLFIHPSVYPFKGKQRLCRWVYGLVRDIKNGTIFSKNCNLSYTNLPFLYAANFLRARNLSHFLLQPSHMMLLEKYELFSKLNGRWNFKNKFSLVQNNF